MSKLLDYYIKQEKNVEEYFIEGIPKGLSFLRTNPERRYLIVLKNFEVEDYYTGNADGVIIKSNIREAERELLEKYNNLNAK